MATLNPLEQKARSSFIKGFILAIFIGILIAGFLGMQLFKMNGKEKQRIAAQKYVMILKRDIKSGDLITDDMFTKVKVDADVAAKDAVDEYKDLQDYFLQDTNGNKIVNEEVKNEYKKYIYINAEAQDKNQGKHEVLTDDNGKYYYKDSNGTITYITLADTALVAKISLSSKTVITRDMFSISSEQVTNDLREQEYNSVLLPSNLTTGDTVDIRLRLPSGLDYIVVSKKMVTVPKNNDVASNTMFIKVKEEESLFMSAAIVDAYKLTGSKLYAVKYTDPGIQQMPKQTYAPSSDVLALIESNPNIVTEAKNALITYYNANYNRLRTGIANALDKVPQDQQTSSVQSGTASETASQTSLRQSYLQDVE